MLKVDLATGTSVASFGDDTGEELALTPSGATAYIASTGQYDLLATNTTGGAETSIEVGAYPQDVAVPPDGSTVYATVTGGETGPGGSDKVARRLRASHRRCRRRAQPYSVTITPNGSTVYVADENSNSGDVISTATGRVTGSIAVQGPPMSIAASPDGSQVWVGNGYSGAIPVISTATNTVIDTISGGGQATALNSAITDIAFGPASQPPRIPVGAPP